VPVFVGVKISSSKVDYPLEIELQLSDSDMAILLRVCLLGGCKAMIGATSKPQIELSSHFQLFINL
jgi:hypothetical protein